MKPSSAKDKGRRGCKEAKEILLAYAPWLKDDDIQVRSSGANGEDLMFSPFARETYPFSVEVKNTESLNVWKSYEQACSNCKEHMPLLIFKRNRSKPMVALTLDDFLKLTQGVRNGTRQHQPEVYTDMLSSVSDCLSKGKV